MLHHPIIRALFLGIAALVACNMILSLPFGHVLLLVLAVSAVVFAVISWMLTHQRARLGGVYRLPVARQAIDLVCKMSKQQPPVAASGQAPRRVGLRLATVSDFERATEEVLSVITGHDSVIRDIMSQLRKNVMLRAKSKSRGPMPPIAAFLLAGASGYGKRSTALRIGQTLHANGGVLVLDMQDYSDPQAAHSLFGNGVQDGILIGAVKSRPSQTIVFDNANMAASSVLDRLGKILTGDAAVPEGVGTIVSFEQCIFILLVHRIDPVLESAADPTARSTSVAAQLTESLCAETRVPRALLSSLHHLFYFGLPDEVTKAQIMIRLMERECQRYNVRLRYVAPEILVDELQAVSPESGFEFMPPRIARLLKDPLLRATQNNLPHLSLERNEPYRSPREETIKSCMTH